MRDDLPLEITHEVRDRCLCLHLQRAARAIGRRFDEALRPLGLTNGQYSLLVSLNRPEPPRMGDVAHLLALDRTTLTANLKPLNRRGLLEILSDPKDGRSRRLALTDAGRDLLVKAVPIWRATHDAVDRMLGGDAEDPPLRGQLLRLTFGKPDGG
ncbi:MarR family winged helix-turn-helix transcriptional regulator [Tropicimonas aquimaris]|uniref:MarR family winged helix-turn-helix transcriptional regulator n=1 Tax=Tropicimonas aquimaris TaxID=914152 RepID=A0ABW3IPX4_9RHOB